MRGFRHRLRLVVRSVFSSRTEKNFRHQISRWTARLTMGRSRPISSTRLHLGCGSRRVPGWLNVDIQASDWNVDLTAGWLPWADDSFDSMVSQHVVEHLHLDSEVLPLLNEVNRVVRPGGDIWLSCPDIERICQSYVDSNMRDIIDARKDRFPEWDLGGKPPSHMVNELFYQDGEHKNLFDFELLRWCLERGGFTDVREVDETQLLRRFPEFPTRGDGEVTVYVRASAS